VNLYGDWPAAMASSIKPSMHAVGHQIDGRPVDSQNVLPWQIAASQACMQMIF
jgi:hypothetical protein